MYGKLRLRGQSSTANADDGGESVCQLIQFFSPTFITCTKPLHYTLKSIAWDVAWVSNPNSFRVSNPNSETSPEFFEHLK
jgi:hypothetical protein